MSEVSTSVLREMQLLSRLADVLIPGTKGAVVIIREGRDFVAGKDVLVADVQVVPREKYSLHTLQFTQNALQAVTECVDVVQMSGPSDCVLPELLEEGETE